MDLNNYIRTIQDFPKKGIMFKDISPLVGNPKALNFAIDKIVEMNDFSKIDKIGGFDARGFLFGPLLSIKTGKTFFMIRKKGKLPGKCISESYGLEYGEDAIEIQEDAIEKGDRILLIDDLLATGGTAKAGCNLVEKKGGIIDSIQFIIKLNDIGGVDKLKNYKLKYLLEY